MIPLSEYDSLPFSLPQPAICTRGARIPPRTEPGFPGTMAVGHYQPKRQAVLEYFRSRIISLPQVMFLWLAVLPKRKGQTSKPSVLPCISNLALFYGLGVWFGVDFPGIAQNRKRTWHCREVSMDLIAPWSIQGLCPLQQGAPREAPSGQRPWPLWSPPAHPKQSHTWLHLALFLSTRYQGLPGTVWTCREGAGGPATCPCPLWMWSGRPGHLLPQSLHLPHL